MRLPKHISSLSKPDWYTSIIWLWMPQPGKTERRAALQHTDILNGWKKLCCVLNLSICYMFQIAVRCGWWLEWFFLSFFIEHKTLFTWLRALFHSNSTNSARFNSQQQKRTVTASDTDRDTKSLYCSFANLCCFLFVGSLRDCSHMLLLLFVVWFN